MRTEQSFDVIVIGAGPAGAQAAIHGASEGMKVCIIESDKLGGQVAYTSVLENVMGFPFGITGEQIRQNIKTHLTKWNDKLDYLGYNVCTLIKGEVTQIIPGKNGGLHKVNVNSCQLEGRTIVIASGMKWDNIDFNISNMDSNHFHYGPEKIKTLDPNTRIILVGSGNSVGQAANLAAESEMEVYIIVRNKLNMSEYLKPCLKNDRIRTFLPCVIKDITKNDSTTYSAKLINLKENTNISFEFDRLFWLANSVPNNKFIKASVGIDLSEKGQVIVTNTVSTSIPGIYAIGDIRHGFKRCVATAMGSGSTVISDIYNYINNA